MSGVSLRRLRARDAHLDKNWATRWSTGWIRGSGLFWIMGLKDTERESVCVSERERERARETTYVCERVWIGSV